MALLGQRIAQSVTLDLELSCIPAPTSIAVIDPGHCTRDLGQGKQPWIGKPRQELESSDWKRRSHLVLISLMLSLTRRRKTTTGKLMRDQ